jgi:hypothetical protein
VDLLYDRLLMNELNIRFLCIRGCWGFCVSEIIDDLAEQMDRTDSRVRNETRQVTVVDRKDNTCCKFRFFSVRYIPHITEFFF